MPAPAEVVKQAEHRQRLHVAWYGGGRRAVEVVTGTAHGYQAGQPWVAVVWVWVQDRTATHREEYFFTTDVRWAAAQVIETSTGRWSLETTFQEMPSHLGLERTRGWCEPTVLRGAPCLFGRDTVVAGWYVPLLARRCRRGLRAWVGKGDMTFSGALTAVRRWLWVEWVFVIPGHATEFSKLSRPFQQLLLAGLTPAA